MWASKKTSARPYRFQPDNFSAGIYQFCFGLAKKVLLADVLSLFVDSCFVIREIPNSTMAFLGMFAYSLQIYFDFSGYSDMAVGIAKLFNIEIINNFNSPYKAITVGDFWKRWHISLTRFFTKYIYIPLGGNRKGLQRTCFNILIVFLVSGLWHGSNWTFIVWGVSHGLILVLERILNIHIPNQPITKALGRFATFMIVSVLWVFFRSDNISTAIKFIKEMCAFNFLPIEDSAAEVFLLPGIEFILTEFNLLSTAIYLPYIFLGLCFILTQFGDNIEQRTKSLNYRKTSNAIIAAILAILSIISFSSVSKFIYWNF